MPLVEPLLIFTDISFVLHHITKPLQGGRGGNGWRTLHPLHTMPVTHLLHWLRVVTTPTNWCRMSEASEVWQMRCTSGLALAGR